MPVSVTDLEGAQTQLVCPRKTKTTVLGKEQLVVFNELWIQHEIHWLPVLAWWSSAFRHPYVALTVVVVVHEV